MWSSSKGTLRASVDPILAVVLQSNPTITVHVCVCTCTWAVPDVILPHFYGSNVVSGCKEVK